MRFITHLSLVISLVRSKKVNLGVEKNKAAQMSCSSLGNSNTIRKFAGFTNAGFRSSYSK